MEEKWNNRNVKLLMAVGVSAFLLVLSLIDTAKVLMDKRCVFAFNDGAIESMLAPSMRYPAALFGIWSNHFFYGYGAAGAPFTTWSLLESVLGPHEYRRIGVLLAIWFTGLAGYWAVRQMRLSRTASLFAAIVFMLCGWNLTFPMNGLTTRSFTLAWSLLSLGMIEKGLIRRHWLYYALGGACLGMGVSETPDAGILFSLCCGAYFVLSHFENRRDFVAPVLLRKVSMFAIYVGASLVIAWQVMAMMFTTQISNVTQGDSEDPVAKYAWATQWSLPKSETWSLMACDFHGASSRSAASPYWGEMGRNEGWEDTKQGFRNFRLAGYAFGVVPFVIVLVLMMHLFCRRRAKILNSDEVWRAWVFLALAVISLMLAWGRHFFLYKLFYQLPYMSTIRNPDKWLGPFSLFLGLAFAVGVELILRLRARTEFGSGRRLMKLSAWIGSVLALISCAVLIFLFAAKQYFMGRLTGEGYGSATEVIWENAVSANNQFLVAFVIASVVLWLYVTGWNHGKRNYGPALLLVLGCVMVFQLLKAGTPFVDKHDYSYVLRPNVLTEFLDKNTHNGRLAIFPSRQPVFNNWRMTYLNAKDYYLFDPESVSRMPTDYTAFFQALAKNQPRLWQMGAIRYMLCTKDIAGQLKQFNKQGLSFKDVLSFGVTQDGAMLVPSAYVPDDQKQAVVVEFENALPLFYVVGNWSVVPDDAEGDKMVLQRLSAASFNPAAEAIVSGVLPAQSGVSTGDTVVVEEDRPTYVRVKVLAQEKTLLVRDVKHHPFWSVEIDGNAAALYRVNYLFQGVVVPAGEHEISYAFTPPRGQLMVSVAGRILLLLGLLASCVIGRPNRNDVKQ